MRKFNPFRSKLHRNKTRERSNSNQSLQISAPIILCIEDEEQTTSITNNDLEEQISEAEETETMSVRYEQEDDQVD